MSPGEDVITLGNNTAIQRSSFRLFHESGTVLAI